MSFSIKQKLHEAESPKERPIKGFKPRSNVAISPIVKSMKVKHFLFFVEKSIIKACANQI